MSKSSANQYADVDGTMYIDTYGTLRFTEKENISVLEFYAANESHGVSLGAAVSEPLYDVLYTGYSKASAISEIFGLEKPYFNIASDIISASDNSYKVNLDYIYNGVPVLINENGVNTHAVTMKFNINGELISYRQYLAGFAPESGYSSIPGVLDAINLVYSSMEAEKGGSVFIKDISACYTVNGAELEACLCVFTGENGEIYTIPSN